MFVSPADRHCPGPTTGQQSAVSRSSTTQSPSDSGRPAAAIRHVEPVPEAPPPYPGLPPYSACLLPPETPLALPRYECINRPASLCSGMQPQTPHLHTSQGANSPQAVVVVCTQHPNQQPGATLVQGMFQLPGEVGHLEDHSRHTGMVQVRQPTSMCAQPAANTDRQRLQTERYSKPMDYIRLSFAMVVLCTIHCNLPAALCATLALACAMKVRRHCQGNHWPLLHSKRQQDAFVKLN